MILLLALSTCPGRVETGVEGDSGISYVIDFSFLVEKEKGKPRGGLVTRNVRTVRGASQRQS